MGWITAILASGSALKALGLMPPSSTAKPISV